jgi:hypothetical protein
MSGQATTTTATTTATGPKIGGLTSTSSKAWTGGAPDAAWTKSSRSKPYSPFCIRDDEDAKVYKFCTASGDKKPFVFHRKDTKMSLKHFSDEVLKHLEISGMDAVFYVPDPADPSVMLNIITYHSRFTIDMVSEFIHKLTNETDSKKPKYDEWDLDNLLNSRLFLENVLAGELLHSIRSSTTEVLTGPEFWMYLIAEVQSSSLERLRQIEQDIKNKLKPSLESGENIKTLCVKINEACDELERAEVLPQDIILTIVNNFCESKVEPFRHAFLNRRADVRKYLKRIQGKDKSVVAAIPKHDRISYASLCKEACDEYQALIDTKQWPPAGNAGDKGDAPEALVAQVSKLVRTEVDKLNGKGKTDANVTCYYCKQTGHMKRECPKLLEKSGGESSESKSSGGGNQPSSQGGGNGQGKNAWRKVAPADGAPQTKTVGTRVWKWCAHPDCKKWQGHGTSEHDEGKKKSKTSPQGAPSGGGGDQPVAGLAVCGW